jgi:MFS transporter, ACS family, pantothenate transporter
MSVTEVIGHESSLDRTEVVVKEKVQRKWQSYIWDTLDKSPEERKFLFKLDAALLTFASLGKTTY